MQQDFYFYFLLKAKRWMKWFRWILDCIECRDVHHRACVMSCFHNFFLDIIQVCFMSGKLLARSKFCYLLDRFTKLLVIYCCLFSFWVFLTQKLYYKQNFVYLKWNIVIAYCAWIFRIFYIILKIIYWASRLHIAYSSYIWSFKILS